MLKRFIEDESGATAIEYGLIASLFGVLMVTAFGTMRTEFETMYAYIEATMVANAPTP